MDLQFPECSFCLLNVVDTHKLILQNLKKFLFVCNNMVESCGKKPSVILSLPLLLQIRRDTFNLLMSVFILMDYCSILKAYHLFQLFNAEVPQVKQIFKTYQGTSGNINHFLITKHSAFIN